MIRHEGIGVVKIVLKLKIAPTCRSDIKVYVHSTVACCTVSFSNFTIVIMYHISKHSKFEHGCH